MILQLMRFDLVRKALPWITALTAFGWFIAGLFPDGMVVFRQLLTTALPIAGFTVVTSQLGTTSYLAPLPVTVRDIYVARVLSMVSVIWLPLAAVLVAGLFSGATTGRKHVLVPMVAMAGCAAFSTLVLLVIQSVLIRRPRRPQWFMGTMAPIVFLPSTLATAILIPSIRYEAETVFSLVLAVAAGVGAYFFHRTWKTLPPSAETTPGRDASSLRVDDTPRHAHYWIPYLRSVYSWNYLIWLPILILQSSMLGGFFACLYLLSAFSAIQVRIPWLLALPVSRRRILLAVAMPMLAALLAGNFLNANYLRPHRHDLQVKEQPCGKPGFTMPLEFWERAGGAVPVIKAPWGETFQPPVASIAGRPFYNPYAVSCQNSQRFITWQFNRAYAANRQPPRPRQQLLSDLALIGMALVIWLAFLTNTWYPMLRLRPTIRITILSALFVMCMGVIMADLLQHLSVFETVVAWLSSMPDAGLAITLPTTFAFLGGAVDKLFREAEFPNPAPITRFMATG